MTAGRMVVANTLFDTTRANIEVLGGQGVDIPCAESADMATPAPFKGDIDLPKLDALLSKQAPGGGVACVLMTVTNNRSAA